MSKNELPLDMTEVIEFNVTDMGGNATVYKASSIEELRMRIAIQTGVLSPCIQLFKRSDYRVIEDAHKISEIFDPDIKHPHELHSVNNQESVKQEVAYWSLNMWIRTSMLHLRYGDQNIVEHAKPLKSADTRLRDKMHEWIVDMSHAAWQYQHLDQLVNKIKALIALGLDIDVAGDVGWTLLHEAACCGHMGLLHTLLGAGAHVDVRDETGYTPLHLAAENGHVDAVRALLSTGADPSLATGLDGSTPIHFAAGRGHADVITLLIAAGAGLDVADIDARTLELEWTLELESEKAT